MVTSSIGLDIRANTSRALNEFKKFSSQLDNKFLISGLKLDVVRSALGQINREFQKAIGEQGLVAGSSLRAIENQTSLLTQTFKSFSQEASLDMASKFSEGFSQIAIQAGGTLEDIKKSVNATAWISTDLGDQLRDQLANGIFEFEKSFRRAGFKESYAEIIQQFLAGQITAGDLANSMDPLKSTLGVELMRIAGPALQPSARARSEAVLRIQRDTGMAKKIDELVARADWGGTIIEDLNSRLFNPQAGVFGVLRQITTDVGDKTTILQETRKLIESVFGKQGLFVTFFKQIQKIFGIEDPLRVVISGIRWLTRQFERLTTFLESPIVRGIVDVAVGAVNGVVGFFTNVYSGVEKYFSNEGGQKINEFFKSISDAINSGSWDPSVINEQIDSVGSSIRIFISNIADGFRRADIDKEGEFFLKIFKNLVEEVAKTLGVAISELIKTIFSSKGASVIGGVLSVFSTAIGSFFKGLLGDVAGSIVGTIATAGIGVFFARRLFTIVAGVLGPIAREVARIFGRGPGGGGGGLGGGVARALGFGTRGPVTRVWNRGRGPRTSTYTPPPSPSSLPIQPWLNPPQPPTQSPTPRGPFGGFMAGARGLGRNIAGFGSRYVPNPYLRGAIGLGTLAAILFAGSAGASETNGEQRALQQQRKKQQEEQKKALIRGGVGFAGGLAGSIAGGKLGGMAGIAAGSIIPGIGTGVGGVVGGILGSILGGILGEEAVKKLYDPITDSIGKFGSNVSNFFSKTLPDSFNSAMRGVNTFFINLGKNIENTIAGSLTSIGSLDLGGIISEKIKQLKDTGSWAISGVNSALFNTFINAQELFASSVRTFNSIISSFIQGLRERLPWIPNLNPVQNNFNGLNFTGPSLGKEARMSGGVPLITDSGNLANNKEIIIPPGGAFRNLIDTVESRVALTPNSRVHNVSANFTVTINVNGNLGGDGSEQLRTEVLRILDTAWQDVTSGTVDRGTVVV